MEEVILALCLLAVLDLCSVYPLCLALKYPVLGPSPADGRKASGGTGSFTDASMFAFLYSQFDGFYTLESVKLGPRLHPQLQLWWGGSSQPICDFGGGSGSICFVKNFFYTLNKDLSGIRSGGGSLLAGRFLPRTLQ